jgi:hypothetical protein
LRGSGFNNHQTTPVARPSAPTLSAALRYSDALSGFYRQPASAVPADVTVNERNVSLTLVIDIRSRLGTKANGPTIVAVEIIVFNDKQQPVSRVEPAARLSLAADLQRSASPRRCSLSPAAAVAVGAASAAAALCCDAKLTGRRTMPI